MRLSEVGQVLDRSFPGVRHKVVEEAGYGSLTQMVQANERLELVGDFVRIRTGTKA